MIGRAPAIGGTTPSPGYRASSTVGKLAEQGPLWVSLKGVELANLAGDTLREVTAAAEQGIERIRGTPRTRPSRSCATAACPLTG
jgi:hypothetical protein